MVFCNKIGLLTYNKVKSVTILILIDGFLQYAFCKQTTFAHEVTILILIDGFLQYHRNSRYNDLKWVTILILIDGFLQWFVMDCNHVCEQCGHNPYFNRWFSAILWCSIR